METRRRPELYLLLGIMQAAHSAEECVTRLYEWFPVVVSSVTGIVPSFRMSGDLFLVLNIAIVTFLLSVSPYVFQRRPWALAVARVAATVEIVNGLAHISGAVIIGGYFSGSVSGIGLVVVAALYLVSGRRRDG